MEDHIPSIIKDRFSSPPLRQPLDSSLSRDNTASLSASINETYRKLTEENPDVMEEEAMKRAMELSLLDFALVRGSSSAKSGQNKIPNNISDSCPYAILKVS